MDVEVPDTAELITQLRRRERWLLALAATRSVMLSGAGTTEAMDLIAERSATLTGADATLLFLDDAAGQLRLWAVAGPAAAIDSGRESGPSVDGTDPWAVAMREGAGTYRVRDLPTPAHDGLREIWREADSALIAPIPQGIHSGGVMVCLRLAGRSPFSDDQQPELVGLAEQAAIALDVAERQRQERAVELLADRERIARDLHDHVIQRLFAVGLSLQSSLRHIDDGAVADRVDGAVWEIDAAISDLRAAIFELRSDGSKASLRSRLASIVRGLGDGAPRIHIRCHGAVDTLIDAALAENVLAVVREAVSNAVRHAGADEVNATVTVESGGAVTVIVTDDGVGVAPDAARSGLKNLAARAETLGGRLTIRPPTEPGSHDDPAADSADIHDAPARPGTVLEWSVPMT